MKLFAHRTVKRLTQAIINADLLLLKKQLHKVDAAQLDMPLPDTPFGAISAIELAIRYQHPKVLSQLCSAGANPNLADSRQQPMLYLALQQPQQSLALVSALLQAGHALKRISADNLPQTPLLACFTYCADSTLMLHLGRLLEYGADIDQPDHNGRTPLQQALRREQPALVQFMVQSGAKVTKNLSADGYSQEITDCALRCAEDLRIRKMMMG